VQRDDPVPQRAIRNIVLTEPQHRQLRQELLRVTDALETTTYLKQLVQAALSLFHSLPEAAQLQVIAPFVTTRSVTPPTPTSPAATGQDTAVSVPAARSETEQQSRPKRPAPMKTVQLPVDEVEEIEQLALHLKSALRRQGISSRNVPIRAVVDAALHYFLDQPATVRTQWVERVR
jgi:hypothetical protein